MVLIKHILEDARKRLAVVSLDAPACEAARILGNREMPLVVVCDVEGVAVGVISKSNIVAALAGMRGDPAKVNSGDIMTAPILSCHVEQELQVVWDTMNARSVRSVPILDEKQRPRGVVHARDVAHALLDDVEEEEVLMRNYFLGIGYQ